MSLAEDVDLEEFVTTKDDLSGADIKAVCTEAGLLALRERRMRVTKADFTEAREKVNTRTPHVRSARLTRLRRCFTARTRARRRVCTCSFPPLMYTVFIRYDHDSLSFLTLCPSLVASEV